MTTGGATAPIEELLTGEELAYRGEEALRAARTAPLPAELDARVRAAIGIEGAVHAPARRVGVGRTGRARRRHHGNRLRQVARLQPAGAGRPRARPEKPCALPLPDEGARPGSVPRPRHLPRAAAAAGDLRRRHPDRAAATDPQLVQPRPDEPGHGAHRAAPEPRALGRPAREPALRRSRRGARVSRRLRVARRERPAAAAAARPDLRLRAPVPARLGDRCQPRRARPRACSERTSP